MQYVEFQTMEATYRLKANEISSGFTEAVRKMFENKTIIISIREETDETTYLAWDPANEAYLLESMAQDPVTRFSPNEFRDALKKM